MKTVRAFAPATIANVAVGFDILGFPIESVGDEVIVSRTEHIGVTIDTVNGSYDSIPCDPAQNTATVGLLRMVDDFSLEFGFKVCLNKGIPLKSGMGGSAASAVAAVVAANALLDKPLSKAELFRYALMGEAIASGATQHADNVAPSLFGGLVLVRSVEPVDIIPIPLPVDTYCVLVHPHIEIATREARAILNSHVPLKDYVNQSSNLAGFIAGCYRSDVALMKRSFSDTVIEPQRAAFIPGFEAAKHVAISEGAFGFSISGSGPSVFALTSSRDIAQRIEIHILRILQEIHIDADSWISPVSLQGARVIA